MDTKRRKKERGVKAKMDYVPSKDGKGCPYVAFFPSRYDPLKSGENSEEGVRAEFAAYKNPKPLSRQQELVVRTSEDVDFVGVNYVGEAAGWQPCNYLVGVFDKEKGSLKLVPLAGEKVFRMEPRVRGFEYGRPADEEPEEDKISVEMQKLKRKMLTEAFGSQRSRLRAARYERGIIKEDDLADMKGMENLFTEAAENETLFTTDQALEQANSVIVRNIPPFDLTARSPQGAYPLSRIITGEEWESMDATELLGASQYTSSEIQTLREEKVYPEFILSRLKRLRVEGDKEGSDRRAHILMYMKHLLAFQHAGHGLIKKAADPWGSGGGSGSVNLTEALGIPGPIVTKFLNRFTSKGTGQGSAQRNKEHVELAVSYVLILGLMVDDYQADPFDLASELKLTVSQLRPHYEQLGCKFEQRKGEDRKVEGVLASSAKGKWKVTLPVPLKFPKIKNQPKQRGGGGR